MGAVLHSRCWGVGPPSTVSRRFWSTSVDLILFLLSIGGPSHPSVLSLYRPIVSRWLRLGQGEPLFSGSHTALFLESFLFLSANACCSLGRQKWSTAVRSHPLTTSPSPSHSILGDILNARKMAVRGRACYEIDKCVQPQQCRVIPAILDLL